MTTSVGWYCNWFFCLEAMEHFEHNKIEGANTNTCKGLPIANTLLPRTIPHGLTVLGIINNANS